MKMNFKKLLTIYIYFLFLSIFFCYIGSCVSAPPASSDSGIDELDFAIRDASDYLNTNIPEKSTLVILNIQSDSPDLSEYIIDELIANVVNDRIFTVVDRQRLDEIRTEQNFQYSGEVDDNLAQQIGKFLGAQTIVSGAIGRLGSGYRLRVRALNVLTAQVQGQFNRNMRTSKLITDIIASDTRSGATSGTVALAQSAPAAPAQTTPAPAQTAPAQTTPAVRTYRVGETGPAGGIIFYDKGNNSSGWRYLEAAPYEAEFIAKWSIMNTFVLNTQSAIGNGKSNVQIILDVFQRTAGEWDTAAQICNDLVFNGFNDWFLPSIDELNQMYGQLKRRNLGDFNDRHYWSSTGSRTNNFWDGDGAYALNFGDGKIELGSRTSGIYVRPIRQVAHQ